MSGVTVSVKSHMKQFAGNQEVALDMAALRMATDIHRVSQVFAPEDKSNLVKSGKINRLGTGSYTVSYGSSKVPYARIHELGGFTGRRGTTYITAKSYLETPGDNISKNVKKYLPKV